MKMGSNQFQQLNWQTDVTFLFPKDNNIGSVAVQLKTTLLITSGSDSNVISVNIWGQKENKPPNR
ncbi:hypothetical protein Lal_00050068 [Lupinus albus]|nr:hypothetical protein Lal_00050068 [Lupinus albus]